MRNVECGMWTEECGMWTEGHLNPCGPSYRSDRGRAKYDEIPWSMVQYFYPIRDVSMEIIIIYLKCYEIKLYICF